MAKTPARQLRPRHAAKSKLSAINQPSPCKNPTRINHTLFTAETRGALGTEGQRRPRRPLLRGPSEDHQLEPSLKFCSFIFPLKRPFKLARAFHCALTSQTRGHLAANCRTCCSKVQRFEVGRFAVAKRSAFCGVFESGSNSSGLEMARRIWQAIRKWQWQKSQGCRVRLYINLR